MFLPKKTHDIKRFNNNIKIITFTYKFIERRNQKRRLVIESTLQFGWKDVKFGLELAISNKLTGV